MKLFVVRLPPIECTGHFVCCVNVTPWSTWSKIWRRQLL